jgi:hypothetical protein
MLDRLFGNKSVERILFFLLINGRVYAGKLANHFKLPLTPLQHSLNKLEEIGILESSTEGKMRYFQFNSEHPLHLELETLLRKAYTLLPASIKQTYYDPDIKQRMVKTHKGPALDLIIQVWSKLAAIQTLSFSATSQGYSGWNGIGKGQVQAVKKNDNVILFEEQGTWISLEGQEFAFSNTFRWTLDRFQHLISLEHLRFGEHNPVFLFHLTSVDESTLQSVNSYVCKEDTYLGQVKGGDHFVSLNWRIIGPKKNEEIHYIYI